MIAHAERVSRRRLVWTQLLIAWAAVMVDTRFDEGATPSLVCAAVFVVAVLFAGVNVLAWFVEWVTAET